MRTLSPRFFVLDWNLVRRVTEKPPGVVLWKLRQHILTMARRGSYWRRLGGRLRAEIARVPARTLRQKVLTSVQLITPAHAAAAAKYIRDSHESVAAEILRHAEEVVGLRFRLLGAELACKQLPLPWGADWRLGYEWPRDYFADIDYLQLDSPTDVKYPWELSRFYFALALGQAYQITGEKQYQDCFVALLRDWAHQNPIAYSINWCSPLEVALRGVHLTTASAFFPELEDEDLRFLVAQLAMHGAFLYRNPEYTDIRGNHYTGNLYGLLVLGLLLRAVLPEAQCWLEYAEKRISGEILLQFHPDGVNIEKSTHYHRFVTEMFLYCAILLDRDGRSLPAAARERLAEALEFVAAYIRPDGNAPRIGDADDGFALRLSTRPPEDPRGTLAIGAVWFGRACFKDTVNECPPEIIWLFGKAGLEKWVAAMGEDTAPLSFTEGGYLVSKGNGCYLILDVGEVGFHGRGGHGHLDALSFELFLDHVALFIDPGMPSYTGDIKLRNRYRGTAAHNTAVVDQAEQGTLRPEQLWRLGSEARVSDVEEHRTPDEDLFAARHHGFERLARPVRYHRSLLLNRVCQTFKGIDTFEGEGAHLIRIFFHVAPGITLRATKKDVTLQSGLHSWVFSVEGGEVFVTEGEVSPAYGVRMAAPVIEIRAEAELPAKITYTVKPLHAAEPAESLDGCLL